MKKFISIIVFAALSLIAVIARAQTNEFNHKTGKYLEVDGASIYYEEIKNVGKPILLFLHGGFGNIEDFNPILQIFINDYHIIGIDSRGHGKSTLGTNKLTYKRLKLDVEAVLNFLQLKNNNIIGFSDGGIIAYWLAMENRISIQKIVTIGATWSLSDAELLEKLMENVTVESAIETWFRANFDFYQKHNPSPDFNKFAKSVFEMWTDKTEDGYPQENVENINVPTLIIRGNDDAFPLESAVELTKKINNSLLFNIPFAPHDAHNKYPQIFEIITKEFLNKHEK